MQRVLSVKNDSQVVQRKAGKAMRGAVRNLTYEINFIEFYIPCFQFNKM